ncbi:MAG: Holliday junction resolvase RuvX [Phycisphaerae bacterium]|nr:Holliday junction resolvase RuvX [Phycisphaerae bacterium]
MRYLAVDHGEKRTGLAICDKAETMASPLKVIVGQGGLVKQIVKVVQEECIEAVIVGLPLNMDSTEGPRAESVRVFGAELEKATQVPVIYYDERLSSFDAENKLAGLDLTRKKKKKHLDAVAAASILEAFLDHKHGDVQTDSELDLPGNQEF